METPLWKGAASNVDLGPIAVSKVRSICKAYKQHTGLGVDQWHPRHWSWLSDAALEALDSNLRLAEVRDRWPYQVWATLIFLVNKEDGGGRPLGLLPTPIRVWEVARDPLMREWEQSELKKGL